MERGGIVYHIPFPSGLPDMKDSSSCSSTKTEIMSPCTNVSCRKLIWYWTHMRLKHELLHHPPSSLVSPLHQCCLILTCRTTLISCPRLYANFLACRVNSRGNAKIFTKAKEKKDEDETFQLYKS